MCEQSLIKACQNKIHVLYGCHWRYLEDYEKMSKEDMMNKISFALKDPILHKNRQERCHLLRWLMNCRKNNTCDYNY